MIKLARETDAAARALRKRVEDEVEAPINRAEEKIARARFKLYGTQVYPDATFTLRLNYGTVQAWKEKGVQLSPYTASRHGVRARHRSSALPHSRFLRAVQRQTRSRHAGQLVDQQRHRRW
jgi:hypothetical protein